MARQEEWVSVVVLRSGSVLVTPHDSEEEAERHLIERFPRNDSRYVGRRVWPTDDEAMEIAKSELAAFRAERADRG